MIQDKKPEPEAKDQTAVSAPTIALPKGGGAIRGIGEKFAANPVTGTGSMSVPIATSPGRSGFGPQLSLSYDSGAGNGPHGFGWGHSLPSITRKTDRGLPRYRDTDESDVFILSGAEDLVPVPKLANANDPSGYSVQRYRPRIEGLFARIERWTAAGTGEIHWRSISRDNITTLYGKDNNSRIFDPGDADPKHPTRIFSWLICQSYDDKGNAIVYEYKAENSEDVDRSQVHEKNRNDVTRSAQRYLKTIKYGNKVSRLVEPDLALAQWMFEVVFDYGEHDQGDPKPNDPGQWLCRNDPFSTYRAGFEVRTYRLCRRVLMFHHFKDEDVGDNCLVRSTDFVYLDDPGIAAFIASVTQTGYKRKTPGGYLHRSLPPLEFEYSQAVLSEEVREIDPESVENIPGGLDGSRYQWVDLDGEGLSGILTEQANAWFYKRNLGDGRFGPVESVARIPAAAHLSSGGQQLLDLSGNGQLDLAEFAGTTPGFYQRTTEEDWESFTPFQSLPRIDWGDPNLRFTDLTGDGHADVLIAEECAFRWHPSLAEYGFGPEERSLQPLDEELGPRLVFADGTQSIYLADLSGDGLSDLVRIRNGEVSYWPNLGYGRFGARVTMDNSPLFDHPDLFDQRQVRLADIDGSGLTDIIYLQRGQVAIYRNLSGNGWSERETLTNFPPVDDLSTVLVADLLGTGTACLVWSSPLPGDSRRPMRYVELMAKGKPHLLIATKNNLGAETRVRYAASTRFYLEDRREGRPWITKLPFPVHVVERVETRDLISRNRFVSSYTYHHGYFDGVEREFRGFGMVEQKDTEEFATLSDGDDFLTDDNVDAASHVPPVLTRTWFHTGVYIDRDRVSNFFAGLRNANDPGEYYREPAWRDNDAEAAKHLLDDTILPAGLTAEEEREACRSLKGAMLRQEVYALDGSDKAEEPYAVTEQNFTIRRLESQGDNRNAVFFTHPREAISYHYERNPADPRISHALTLEVDKYGNVLQSLAIGYGRRLSPLPEKHDRDKQTTALITYTENVVTNAIDDASPDPDAYRTPLAAETRTYELTGFEPEDDADRFSVEEWTRNAFHRLTSASTIPYQEPADPAIEQKRLIEHVRTLYRKNDLTALSPLRTVESHALPGEGYKLALTAQLAKEFFLDSGKLLEVDLNTILAGDAGYVHSELDGNWWIPAGRAFYSDVALHTAAEELSEAEAHFFLPRRYRDPFGHDAFVTYDPIDPNPPRYDLLVTTTSDPLGNTVTAAHDYRVLQPRLVTDANGNRAAGAFDALGMVVATAVMGKEGEEFGDLLEGFEADLPVARLQDFLADPRAEAESLLGSATTRIVYDVARFQRTQGASPQDRSKWLPPYAATLARETHLNDPPPPGGLRIQIGFSYSDGLGCEVQKKVQAEPEKVGGVAGPPRWVGSGWTIFNNKGKPVRQYEPFFSDTHQYQFGVLAGVSAVLFYDPVERVVATLHPNDTYEKVVFDPWQQTTFDVNDTVAASVAQTGNPRTDPDIAGYVREYFKALPAGWKTWHGQRIGHPAGHAERDAAEKASAHAGTPTVAHFDALGRPFLTIGHNRYQRSGVTIEENHATRVELDIEGNQRAVTDSKDRVVMHYDYDMLGNRIDQASMEAGERWMLMDVAGKALYAWDSRDHRFRTTYDALRRPTESFLREGIGDELSIGRNFYGEANPTPAGSNQRGKLVQLFDQAGLVTTDQYDFKGNLLSSQRQFAELADREGTLIPAYRTTVDWFGTVQLEPDPHTTSTTYDALDRPLTVTTPDDSVYRPTFNEANLLERVEVVLGRSGLPTAFVKNIDYDAKGQRTQIRYGNNAVTTYEYDPLTFRLTHLRTTRPTNLLGVADSQLFVDVGVLQDLFYTYDPAGNLTRILDTALKTVVHNNQTVSPISRYTYDALYRLIEAEGREHIAQTGFDFNPTTGNYRDHVFLGSRVTSNNLQELRNYIQRYEYDAVGNFETLRHIASGGGWSRGYAYDDASLIEAGKRSNRLSRTTVGNGLNHVEPYTHDAHGNITVMPHLPVMTWDFKDQLQEMDLVGGGRAFYVYDGSGHRVRKVIESQGGARHKERIYLGGYEIYREYGGNGTLGLERETLHVMDNKRRIALVDTQTIGGGNPVSPLIPLQRHQLGNHLGSASVELDDDGALVSYEEYHPYGTTAFQAGRNAAEVKARRYRYTGKERDEESGFGYHGARYYVPWLGRWMSSDPVGISDNINSYLYVSCRPTHMVDRTGLAAKIGDQFRYKNRTPAIWEDGVRMSEDEHGANKASREAVMRNPATGKSDFTRADYRNALVTRQPKEVADPKTREGPTSDNARAKQLNEQAAKGQAIDANKALIQDPLDNWRAKDTGNSIPDAAKVRAILDDAGGNFQVKNRFQLSHQQNVRTIDYDLTKLTKVVGPPVDPATGVVIKSAASLPSAATPAPPPVPVAEPTASAPQPSVGTRIGGGFDAAVPHVAKGLNVAGAAYAAYDISKKTDQTTREKGGVMGAAQFAKTSAKHATAVLWFAVGASVGLALASGGLAAPVAAAAIAALITATGTEWTHDAIDAVTPGLL